ncbi:MAG: sigma-54-dependent Fis family transcriptional regulator [Myxococcota bacterium]
MSSSPSLRLERERDLYRDLLERVGDDDPLSMLDYGLTRLRELVGAEVGYVELEDDATGERKSWFAHFGLDEQMLEVVRERVSLGVIGEARATGKVVHVPSAMLDERFAGRDSVQRGQLEAVLCVPISAQGVSGAVYLQGRVDGGPFSDADVTCVQVVANFLASQSVVVLELLRRRRGEDATAGVRSRLRAEGVLGRSAGLARLLERVTVVAEMEDNVLLLGPPGGGKSTLARVVHDNSRRGDAPFVEINAPTIPETMLEAELFGAQPGAFTGAPAKGLKGKVAAAEGGTLFLDEIGELTLPVQAKLLHLFESKQYYPVGAVDPQTANVRFVAATNRDLVEAVARGEFRSDLHDRLRQIELRVPSLDTRREDIPLLASHFCAEICTANGLPPMDISAVALTHLEFSSWPGNVRQLQNRCRDAVINARIERVDTIELRHLFADGRDLSEVDAPAGEHRNGYRAARDAFERDFFSAALERHDWNVSQTATGIEVSRSHLNDKIKRLGLRRRGKGPS